MRAKHVPVADTELIKEHQGFTKPRKQTKFITKARVRIWIARVSMRVNSRYVRRRYVLIPEASRNQ